MKSEIPGISTGCMKESGENIDMPKERDLATRHGHERKGKYQKDQLEKTRDPMEERQCPRPDRNESILGGMKESHNSVLDLSMEGSRVKSHRLRSRGCSKHGLGWLRGGRQLS